MKKSKNNLIKKKSIILTFAMLCLISFSFAQTYSVNYLIVGGGGSGAGQQMGGGGGGGGVVTGTTSIGIGCYTATVGDGGVSGVSGNPYQVSAGGNSIFNGITAYGGGSGGGEGDVSMAASSNSTASGGGAGGTTGLSGGTGGTQGHNGGATAYSSPGYGGGGGGAGSAGSSGASGGNGGSGSTINGITYGGGGGGGLYSGLGGSGGSGGGGNAASAGAPNTGGGGGGGNAANMYSLGGGSGVIIISFPSTVPYTQTGNPIVSYSGSGNSTTILTYTATGQFCITPTVSPCTPACLSCSTPNFVPVTTSTSGGLSCSQIADMGTGGTVLVGFSSTSLGNVSYSSATSSMTNGSIATSGTAKLAVNGAVEAPGFFTTSDGRLKKDIKKLESPLDKVKKLNGVNYYWNKEVRKERQFDNLMQAGLVAQDLEKIIPEAVIKNADGYYAVNYTMLIPYLIEGIKEQQKQIEELKAVINAGGTNATNVNVSSANRLAVNLTDKDVLVLNQNVPNPFAEQTTITYNIPQNAGTAQLLFYDANGRLIKTIDITTKGAGQLNVYANDLTNGIYTYTLIVDGKIIDTKKMVKQQ